MNYITEYNNYTAANITLQMDHSPFLSAYYSMVLDTFTQEVNNLIID